MDHFIKMDDEKGPSKFRMFFYESHHNLQLKCKPFDYLETKYYNVKNGIYNLFHWFPIVWKDRDWDFEGFSTFLYHKLKRLEKRGYEEVFCDGQWYKDYISLCIRLMDEYRKLEDTYYPEGVEPPTHRFIPSGEFYNGEETLTMILDYKNPGDEQRIRDFDEYKHARLEKLRKLLFSVIEKRSEYWWD